jgi:hypothetical protein
MGAKKSLRSIAKGKMKEKNMHLDPVILVP